MRTRKSVFELNLDEVARLKAAYAALRQLHRDNPSDPRGWYHQGLVHCWYCSGALDAISAPEIHGGWFFLPWHRAYLYFHEQILAELIGDPGFALPYWDWDTPDRNRFPPVYMEPADQSNPLFDPFRAITSAARIPDFLVGPEVMKGVKEAATFALFAGAGEGASGQSGVIEGAPHGGVHLWVTNPADLVPPQVNMGVLGTAALDPVFFAHHCNIDRLWSVWLDAPATPAHANPTNDENAPGPTGPNWWQQVFGFYDHQKQWVQIAVRQVVDPEASLRFRYQPPLPPGSGATPVVAATRPATGTSAAAAPVRTAESSSSPASAGSANVSLTPAPRTLSVGALTNTGPSVAANTPDARRPPRVILRIEGVEVPQDRAAVVKVFLNRPDATAATPASDPGFVGTITVVPNTVSVSLHTHRPVTQRNFSFDVTDKVGGAAPSNIQVTLVPTTGTGTPPQEIALRFQRAHLTTE